MPPIHILPRELADKIAAGEVVERPASVVKELVENALDAGATYIRVDIRKAGRELIQVADNGCGMTLDEAKLSLERHATSKINKLDDLFNIRTLGFRGEALPSIAAVSELTLETKSKSENNLEGALIEARGGEIVQARTTGCPEGTTVAVKNLFFNTPARLKFLKSDGVETGHIEETLIHLALAKLDCGFDFFVDGKQKLSCPVTNDPLVRLKNCLGKLFVEDILPIEEVHPELSLKGWLVHPRQTAKNAQSITFYLNGRFLRDKVLNHALAEGYSDFLMKGQYPKAVLYLEMNPAEVDVNVHPSKREVRFLKPQMVHQFVANGVRRGLYGEGPQTTDHGPRTFSDVSPVVGPLSVVRSPLSSPSSSAQNALNRFYQSKPSLATTRPKHAIHFWQKEEPAFFTDGGTPVAQSGKFHALKVLGAIASTYILCESSDNKLILIDQHAAHERIGFEKLKKNFESKTKQVQRLLMPITWEATRQQASVLNAHLGSLKEAGLEIAPFGGETFVVTAHPVLLPEKAIPGLLEVMAEEFEEMEASGAVKGAIEHVLKTMACHAQVRAKDKLSKEEMEHLLREMDEYHATHCPHGRPTAVEISLGQIERWFKRT